MQLMKITCLKDAVGFLGGWKAFSFQICRASKFPKMRSRLLSGNSYELAPFVEIEKFHIEQRYKSRSCKCKSVTWFVLEPKFCLFSPKVSNNDWCTYFGSSATIGHATVVGPVSRCSLQRRRKYLSEHLHLLFELNLKTSFLMSTECPIRHTQPSSIGREDDHLLLYSILATILGLATTSGQIPKLLNCLFVIKIGMMLLWIWWHTIRNWH